MSNRTFSSVLGDVLFLAASSNIYKDMRTEYLYARLMQPIRHNTFMFASNDQQVPVAFMAWTFFSKERLLELQSLDKNHALRYNLRKQDFHVRGDICFVTDFLCPFGSVRKIVRVFRSNIEALYPEHRGGYYGVKSSDGRLRKIC